MRISKHSNNVLVEAPYILRPGTSCTVKRTCSYKDMFTWDSNNIFTYTFNGLVTVESVKSDITISSNYISIVETDGLYVLTIEPLYDGIIALEIYHYEVIEETIVSVPAFNLVSQTYYLDYIIENSTIYPMSAIVLSQLPENVHELVNTSVSIDSVNNGIAYLKNNKISLSSQGCLQYKDEWVNIIRVGKQQCSVPGDFDGPFIRKENDRKIIEYDNQEWLSGYTEARGVALYYHNVLITTNKNLCVFNWYTDFSVPIITDDTILGYDITNYPDDCIGISINGQIHKFRVKHDNIYIDKESKRIYFREKDPCFALSETL